MLGIKVKEFTIKGERYSYTQGCMLQIEDKWEVYKDGNKYYHYCNKEFIAVLDNEEGIDD